MIETESFGRCEDIGWVACGDFEYTFELTPEGFRSARRLVRYDTPIYSDARAILFAQLERLEAERDTYLDSLGEQVIEYTPTPEVYGLVAAGLSGAVMTAVLFFVARWLAG